MGGGAFMCCQRPCMVFSQWPQQVCFGRACLCHTGMVMPLSPKCGGKELAQKPCHSLLPQNDQSYRSLQPFMLCQRSRAVPGAAGLG